MVWDDMTLKYNHTCWSECTGLLQSDLAISLGTLPCTEFFSQDRVPHTDSLFGGEVFTVIFVVKGPVVPVLVTAAT